MQKDFYLITIKKTLQHISGEKDWVDLTKLDNLKEWEIILKKNNKLSY